MIKITKMVLIIGLISSLFSCTSERQKEDIEQQLHARIAECTPHKFDISNIMGATDSGSMNLSGKAATLTWKEYPEVVFKYEFNYQKGKVLFDEEDFLYWFNRAKKDVDNRRAIEPLVNETFKNPFGLAVRIEHQITLNCNNVINDETVHQEIENARQFAIEAAKILGQKVDVNIGYTTKTEEYLEKKYCRPMFQYRASGCSEDGAIRFEKFGNDSSCANRELRELVQTNLGTSQVTVFGKDALYLYNPPNSPNKNFDHVRVDWFNIEAMKDEEKITGKINIHTKEIVWDEITKE